MVFLGTGEIAVPTLRHLAAAGPRPSMVVTQPDRPVGRHQVPTPPAVKAAALDLGIPVFQPESMRDEAACERVAGERPDVAVVMAYGQWLPKRLLAIPRIACINLHASLLPRHRGAACIQAAIDAGDAETGMTVMHVAPKLDTGDLILSRSIPIGPDDTAGSLHDRLAELAPGALAEALEGLAAGTAPRMPQDEEMATHIGKLGRDDGRIDWTWPAERLGRRIRAFDPWPGTFTTFAAPGGAEKRLKLFPPVRVVSGADTPDESARRPAEPGALLRVEDGGLIVACGQGALHFETVQPDGSRRMSGGEFARGRRLLEGKGRFGTQGDPGPSGS